MGGDDWMVGDDWMGDVQTGWEDQKGGDGLSDRRVLLDGRGLLAKLYYGKCFKNMNITKHLVSFNTGVASMKID